MIVCCFFLQKKCFIRYVHIVTRFKSVSRFCIALRSLVERGNFVLFKCCSAGSFSLQSVCWIMTDTLTVVIIASVVAACTSTLTGAFQHYFQYVQSLIWVAIARCLNIHAVEFHQSKINTFAGAIFDKLSQDSHCRSFTYKASSWADGNLIAFVSRKPLSLRATLLE